MKVLNRSLIIIVCFLLLILAFSYGYKSGWNNAIIKIYEQGIYVKKIH